MKPRPLFIAVVMLAIACGDDGSSPSGDTTPPSQPAGLTAIQLPGAYVRLSWQEASDDIGVTGYTVRARDVELDLVYSTIETLATAYIDSIAVPWFPVRYSVTAHDDAGNVSQSVALTFTVEPTTADIAGPWPLRQCVPNQSTFASDCAGDITFVVNADSTITGTVSNLELVAPKGGGVYGVGHIADVAISGAILGRTVSLTLEPTVEPDIELTSGTITLQILARVTSDPNHLAEYRLRLAEGAYAFSGRLYQGAWFDAVNSGALNFER